MPRFLTLSDRSFKGETVLVRADLNVPFKEGRVTDASRLTAFLPTLAQLTSAGAKVVILSHFGRPKGKDAAFSLRPIANALAELFHAPIAFAPDCIGPAAQAAISALPYGQAVVLENTRFYDAEEANDPAFAKTLADLGTVYVNDAFSAAHRAHASTEGIAHHLPAYAGRLMQAELEALGKALETPARPVAALVGGAKISTKLALLENLITKVDALILGGGMANTFLAAQGKNLGRSLSEPEMFDTARAIMSKAKAANCRILLPTDLVLAAEFKADASAQTVSVDAVPPDQMALDLGPQSVQAIIDTLAQSKTVVWNGPLGAFEIPPFDRATLAIAREVARLTTSGALLSVGGGGDTVAALAKAGISDQLTYVSMAGGAFLEWLEGKPLPGVAALVKSAAAHP